MTTDQLRIASAALQRLRNGREITLEEYDALESAVTLAGQAEALRERVAKLEEALRNVLLVGVPSGADLALLEGHGIDEECQCHRCNHVRNKISARDKAKEVLG